MEIMYYFPKDFSVYIQAIHMLKNLGEYWYRSI